MAPTFRSRTLAAALALLVVAGASVALARTASVRPRFESRGPVYTVRTGRMLYSFDAAWRVERLSVVSPGGSEEPLEDESDRVRMRTLLLQHLGAGSLDGIPSQCGTAVQSLQALGYL